jgi:hypothetical protein
VTRETTIDWPENRLGCPLRADYRGRVDEQFRRTEVDDGPPRYRRVRNAERRIYGLTFLWTLEKLDYFERWMEGTLDDGMRWFMLPSLTGKGMVPMFAHMLGGYEVTPDAQNIELYRISFEVEAYHSPASAPVALLAGGPIDASWPLYVGSAPDIIDGRPITQPRPADLVDPQTPGAMP